MKSVLTPKVLQFPPKVSEMSYFLPQGPWHVYGTIPFSRRVSRHWWHEWRKHYGQQTPPALTHTATAQPPCAPCSWVATLGKCTSHFSKYPLFSSLSILLWPLSSHHFYQMESAMAWALLCWASVCVQYYSMAHVKGFSYAWFQYDCLLTGGGILALSQIPNIPVMLSASSR